MPAVKPVRRKRHREAPAEADVERTLDRDWGSGSAAIPASRPTRPLSKPTKEISTLPSERLPRGVTESSTNRDASPARPGLDADSEL